MLLSRGIYIHVKLFICSNSSILRWITVIHPNHLNQKINQINQINQISKRNLCPVYEMEDANFEDLLLKGNSWNVHKSNLHTLLIEIYKSINSLRPPIMKDLFDLKNTWYDLRSKQLLKLPETSTSRYGTEALCFKGSLIWNMVPNKIKNIDNIEDFKKHIKRWKPFGLCHTLISFCWYLLVELFSTIL